jgi:hypothetical protein
MAKARVIKRRKQIRRPAKRLPRDAAPQDVARAPPPTLPQFDTVAAPANSGPPKPVQHQVVIDFGMGLENQVETGRTVPVHVETRAGGFSSALDPAAFDTADMGPRGTPLPLRASLSGQSSMRGELSTSAEQTAGVGLFVQQPALIPDISKGARALANEFTEQVAELNRQKPNNSKKLAAHNKLVSFFERMAAGLTRLADDLDAAVAEGNGGKPEPVLLGKAATVARELHSSLMQWLDENQTLIVDVPIRLGLFGAGVAYLHMIGADGAVALTALTALLLKRGKRATTKKSKK